MLISNIREDGKPIGSAPDGELQWHSDQCHRERPAAGTFLYAIEIPSRGGDTLFANAYQAYETLPDRVKRRFEGRRALHAYDSGLNPVQRPAKSRRMRLAMRIRWCERIRRPAARRSMSTVS